jgi:signal transduction histidine kinase
MIQGVFLTISVNQLITLELKEMLRSKGVHLSKSLLARSKDLLLTGDIVKLYKLLQEEQRNNPDIRYAFVLDHEGRLIAHTFREGVPAVLLSVHPPGGRSRLLNVANDLLYDLQVVEEWGAIRLGLSLSGIEASALRVRNYVMLGAFASILAVFALALTISRPVERLTAFVAKAAAEGTHGADPEVLGTLETSKLCEAFANVMQQLQAKVKELTDLEKTVRHQKEYIENLHDTLGLGIVVLRARGDIEFANRIAGDQLGITAGEAPKALFDLEPIGNADPLPELIKAQRPFQGLWRSESGQVFEIGGMRILNPDASASILLRLQDVSEEVALREKLEQAQKMAYLGGLTASVAHGVNNPLGVVLMRSEMLLADAKREALPPKYIHGLSKIKGHAARAGQIIQGLLLFSRHGTGAIPTQRQVFNLNDLVAESLGLLGERLLAHTVQVGLALEEKLPEIQGDRGGIQQVLINLIDNAIDAMDEGGHLKVATRRVAIDLSPGADKRGEHAVDTSCQPQVSPADFVEVSVADTGCGMTEEVKARAFEPFFTTKDITKGTGLGLSISYGIVKEHGGEMAIESWPDEGTIITVRFPVGSL